MYVCLSVCNMITFENLTYKFVFGLRGIRVKFLYEGHGVKVKVTAAKMGNSLFPQC